ncbi:MAG: NADH-quinone oxidoreductase subunit C [Planctomycetota bacterium]|nr:MAG: NADH-quinone oxidoreductase subunit C [Planctomycetota bacterium]
MLTAKEIIETLRTKFNNHIIKADEKVSNQVFVRVVPDTLVPLIRFLSKTLSPRFLINAGTDLVRQDGKYLVSYIFSFDSDKIFLCIEVAVDAAAPDIDSITPIIAGANWSERETRDLLGINLRNHPDPRRLVLADDWPQGLYPLRRDFPYDYKPPSEPQNKVHLKKPPEGTKVIPIGPFYPVLEEPAYFKLFVDGETVVDCDYRGFYNHRGIEKIGDTKLTYNQICFMAERICGICGFIHSTCYCEAVEQAAGIEVPLRAHYIRTIMLELERIHSHLLWLGIATHIIGFDTLLMQAWRIREPVMWLCEKISGNRKTYGMNLIGGVRRDIPHQMHDKIITVIEKIERETLEVIDAVMGDTSLHVRLKDVGILTEEVGRSICTVGPTARGSGIPIDSRVDHPYAAYDRINFEVAVESGCDIWARTLVRLKETMESIKIVKQCLLEMPDGPIMGEVMEEIPSGREAICCVEAPRGEAVHYVQTGQDNRPYRWRVRAPTYPNLQCIPNIIKGERIADVPIIIGSLDPCYSCTERMAVVDVKTGVEKLYTKEEIIKR